MEWALAELMLDPRILDRAHEETDRVIGRDRHLRETDLPKLPYLRAICKEALRKHPSTPLIPRRAARDCGVDGYDIPRGARLTVNVRATGRDPEAWENPLELVPERFLSAGKSAEIDPWGNDFELIPFGGREEDMRGDEARDGAGRVHSGDVGACFRLEAAGRRR